MLHVVYELLYLTPLQDSDAARATIHERIVKVLQDAGASIAASREFARQRLSYPIKKQRAGEYSIIEFTAPGKAIASIERELRLLSDILRIFITEKLEAARAVGQEIALREQQQAQEVAAKAAVADRAAAPAAAPAETIAIEDLDKKLEEILGKEMV